MNEMSPSFRLQAYSLAPERPPRSWAFVVILVSLALAAAIVWSSLAQVDELARAEGKVIPSGKTQIIQTAEPEMRNRRTVTEVSGFVGSHPLVLNGKYAEIIWREYVGSATRGSEGFSGTQSEVAGGG